ncbi:MAG: M23 family metallopeptidase [Kiritimatiellae bacterium]|nr:M23 family metallopeptidase [Kiritimatiellia bacterium]
MCVIVAKIAGAIKLFCPQVIDASGIGDLRSKNWDISAVKNLITTPSEMRQLAIDLYEGIFGKTQPEEDIKSEPQPVGIMTVRSYGVSEYLQMSGMGGDITTPETKYLFPALGYITSQYGWREHPVSEENSFHTGIDIAVNEGDDVYSVCDGTVSDTGSDDVYGNYIVISHPDGSESFYAHLKAILVAENKSVKAGERVALSGSTGLVTGPHLHFELRRGGETLDPVQYLGGAA